MYLFGACFEGKIDIQSDVLHAGPGRAHVGGLHDPRAAARAYVKGMSGFVFDFLAEVGQIVRKIGGGVIV